MNAALGVSTNQRSYMKKTIEEVVDSVSSDYKADLEINAPYERDFIDEDKHWYSPFILWDLDEVKKYQPSYDQEMAGYLAIGSNGGMETYVLSIKDGSVYVCDLIAGIKSLELVASSYAKHLCLLKQ